MEKSNKILIGLGIIGLVVLASGEQNKSNKKYNSSVYSSWEEERIDELEADVSYLIDKLEKRKY